MWIQAPIYEILPYSCVVGGGIAVLSLDNLLAWVSGAVRITLGALIWIVRRQHRRAAARSRRG
jgi:hypothetical protein